MSLSQASTVPVDFRDVFANGRDSNALELSIDSLSSVVNANTDFRHAPSLFASKNNMNTENMESVPRQLSSSSTALNGQIVINSNSIPQNVSTILSDEEVNQYGYTNVDGVYPSIPLNVAQYVNQQNPDLCAKVADVLRKSGNAEEEHNQKSAMRFVSNLPPSPLRSMANTSEALALQHSVIGSTKIKPVSPELVAKIVESTRMKINSDDKFRVAKVSSSSLSDQQHLLGREINGVLYNEILRYPPETITATIEKRSWIGQKNKPSDISSSSSSSSPARPGNVKKEKQRHNSQSSTTSSVSSKKDQKSSQNHLPATHYGRKVSDDVFSKLEKERRGPNDTGNETEFGSSVSDMCDLESSFSDTYDTESAFSGISGIEEEMSQVKKLLINFSNKNGMEKYRPSLQSLAATSATQTDRDPSSGLQVPVEKLCDRSTETDSIDDFQILRQKVALEGELETLKKELDAVLKENHQFQTVTMSVEAQLSSQKTLQEQLKVEKELMTLEIEKVQREKQQWKNVIDEYQSIVDTKNSEIKSLKEDIATVETDNEKLKITHEELKVDMESKDGAVQGLKRKIAELHVELQTMLQGKIQLQNDLKSIEAEKVTLQKSKEWYQEQLHSFQESRNKLHQDLISHQAACTTSSSTAERFRVENAHLKRQLLDVQQKAIKEKEMLMKHLENIEADMLEREAIFQQLKRDEGSASELISERLKKMEEEQSKFTNISFKASDLEHKLDSVNKTLEDREDSLKLLASERVELTKRVTLMQKSLNDQVLINQQLEQQQMDFQNKVKYMELELKSKDDQVSGLKTEKTAIEVALAAANGEKRLVGDALKVVKENLNKVEGKFNLMKSELVGKASQSEQLMKEKERMEDSLQQLEEQMFQQKRSIEVQKNIDHINRSAANNDHHHKNEEMDGVLSVLKVDLKQNEVLRFRLLEENNVLKQELQNSIETIERLKEFELENQTMKRKMSSLEKAVANFGKPKTNVSCTNYETCAHLDHIETLLQATEQRHREKTRVYESNIKVLTRKLKEVLKENKRKDCEREDLKNRPGSGISALPCKEEESCRSTVSVQTEQNRNDGDSALTDVEKMARLYEETIKDLERELAKSRDNFQSERLLLEKNQHIILDLEKEKGHLKGFEESNAKLKERVVELEGILADKENSVSELGRQTECLREKRHEDEMKVHDHLKGLEQDLANEKALIKELRHQVFQEKRDHSHLKRHVANLKNGLNQASQMADSRQQNILRLQGELELKHQAELKHRSEMESLHTECKRLASESKRLQKELEETQARDPALAQQIKTLSWHVKEKNQELTSVKERCQLLEERSSTEVESFKTQIQSMIKEMEDLRSELVSTRKEKFSFQAKISELRGALKSSVDLNKQLRRDLSEKPKMDGTNVSSLPLPESPAPYDEKFINSLLQQSLVLPESRPLSNLQACLNALKQEMSIFQQQLQEHANT